MRTKDLKDTKYLITTQLENEDAADVLSDTYDRFRHPETNRMMALVSRLNKHYELMSEAQRHERLNSATPDQMVTG